MATVLPTSQDSHPQPADQRTLELQDIVNAANPIKTHTEHAIDWLKSLKIPWWTGTMSILYLVLYYTICQDQDSQAVNDLELNLPAKADQVYRWYTYSLLHGNDMHIGVNLMGWTIYGLLCEIDNGWWRTAAIQTGAILGGSMAAGWDFRITKPRRYHLIGASGGVYGMLSSLIGNLLLNWNELILIKKIVYPAFIICTLTSDIIVNIIMPYAATSYSAHVGGFVFGVLGGICMMRNKVVRPWEIKMRYAAGALWLAIIFMGSVNMGLLNDTM